LTAGPLFIELDGDSPRRVRLFVGDLDPTCAAVIFRFISWSAHAIATRRPYGPGQVECEKPGEKILIREVRGPAVSIQDCDVAEPLQAVAGAERGEVARKCAAPLKPSDHILGPSKRLSPADLLVVCVCGPAGRNVRGRAADRSRVVPSVETQATGMYSC
jgi:hypothetical protein